ncbi:hypothetical protein AALP_AA1G258600 [Arabis alpina]|uniref:BURP domain-containing protein n=1 Tax=Arabis alpina TaxID=50452 RepID=A0A087HQP9_ARAAL|nr:hypothetical protein AALP_AA1G258600 [Arabis alpina]
MFKQLGFLLSFLSYLLHVVIARGRLTSGGFSPELNPFTPKASLVRYWNREIQSQSPGSEFLLSKASPLTAVASAVFAKLASENSLPDRLPDFCFAANLFCFPDLGPSLERHGNNVKFSVYDQRNFTNYGTVRAGGDDSFKKYSQDGNVVTDSFRQYSREGAGHDEKFKGYGGNSNVVEENFNSYGKAATGGSGDFRSYQTGVNNPTSRFTSYSDNGNGESQTFKTYTHEANAGPGQSFTSYGKNGNGAPNEFTSYGVSSNVIGSDFSNYGENGNVANDTFKGYGGDGNVPKNNFKSYGASGNAGVDTFLNYRDKANVGDDSFSSYAKNSNSESVGFVNYGKSFNPGSESFKGYGKGAEGNKIDFKTYTQNSTFKDYAKTGLEFARYNQSGLRGGKAVNKWVEPGKFFRESMLKEGTLVSMPDIKDRMPKRSFLPRSIISKIPFSTSKIAEIKGVFHARDNSTMEGIISNAITECERPSTVGETKRCVGSAEDMIDFATSVLGRRVVLRTTKSVAGSKKKVVIGKVKGINGGNVTKSVSCHQSLYPYLLYYCHSVPKVRVYESDLLDPKSKVKINHGIAICHMDTSAWGANHGAFVSLGSRPGQIEICHWIFENDMNWSIAD